MYPRILFNILTGKQRPHIKADAKTFVDKIGMDQIGWVVTIFAMLINAYGVFHSKELMEQSGFQLIEVEEDEIKRKRWTLSLDNDSAVKTATRAWVELGMRLAGVDNRMWKDQLYRQLPNTANRKCFVIRREQLRGKSL